MIATRADALGPDIRSEIGKVAAVGFALDLEAYQPRLHCVAVPWREHDEGSGQGSLTRHQEE